MTAMPTEQRPMKPPVGKTRLVSKPDEQQVLVMNQETDARTALTRGLKEYLEQLEWEASGGRKIRFERAVDTWADMEDGKVPYPSVAVQTTAPGIYDASKFAPAPANTDMLPNGLYLVSPCELVAPMQVEVWSTDTDERMALSAMLEQSLISPTTWMYGVRLALPHYFGLHAEYEFIDSSYQDSDVDATRRKRNLVINMTGRVPVARPISLPLAVVLPASGLLTPDMAEALRAKTGKAILRLALEVE